MANKTRVMILFGGKSAEHEVSILSARNVYQALDKTKYDVTLVGIDRDGQWYLSQNAKDLLDANPTQLKMAGFGSRVTLTQSEDHSQLVAIKNQTPINIDVCFPVMHGPMGEDGTVQGMLKLLNIPFVGPSVLGSAVGMDKDVMKRLLREAGIPIAKFKTLRSHESLPSFSELQKELGTPMFVKPANMGSSVGVSKIKTEVDYKRAVAEAFKYDTKILIEEGIDGREIECSILGNENPKASLPGEVLNNSEFYSYESKYVDPNGASTKIPADLPKDIVARVQQIAIKTFQVLECEGMGRVDCFLKSNGDVLINEINTIPGFTKISMYPKMWEASGVSYTELIDKLIQLALDRHTRDSKIKTTPDLKSGSFKA